MAFIAMCWTAVLLVESAHETPLYPSIRTTLRILGNGATYLIHDSRTLTYKNTDIDETYQTRLHATGLFVVNRYPPIGSHIYNSSGDYVLIDIQRNDMPILLNLLLSGGFLLFAGMAAHRHKTLLAIFSVGKRWYSKCAIWLSIAWGFFATIKLLLRGVSYVSDVWSRTTFYTVIAVVCIASWGLTYTCRFIKKCEPVN